MRRGLGESGAEEWSSAALHGKNVTLARVGPALLVCASETQDETTRHEPSPAVHNRKATRTSLEQSGGTAIAKAEHSRLARSLGGA